MKNEETRTRLMKTVSSFFIHPSTFVFEMVLEGL